MPGDNYRRERVLRTHFDDEPPLRVYIERDDQCVTIRQGEDRVVFPLDLWSQFVSESDAAFSRLNVLEKP